MSIPTTDIPDTIDVDLENGQQVGEYVVEGKLGQGAFGTVFKATHPLIGKNVAVKVLSHRFSVDPEMVSRFVAEARAVNQIQHRHIIDIFSFGKLDDGRQYYVMEYLDGETLDALLGRGRVPIGEALTILRAIAKALDAAHAKGIAHRDLKAENIFLARDTDGGVFPKLLDFGIAKLLGPEDTL
ncbi:MAG: serine/threonine protein kinase, partial [Kofleriaceae bacterium]